MSGKRTDNIFEQAGALTTLMMINENGPITKNEVYRMFGGKLSIATINIRVNELYEAGLLRLDYSETNSVRGHWSTTVKGKRVAKHVLRIMEEVKK